MNRNTETCHHVYPDSGKYSLIVNGETVTCAICGETFKHIDGLTCEEVFVLCDKVNSIIQMTKVNLGPLCIKDDTLFELNRLIKELPRLYKMGQERLSER